MNQRLHLPSITRSSLNKRWQKDCLKMQLHRTYANRPSSAPWSETGETSNDCNMAAKLRQASETNSTLLNKSWAMLLLPLLSQAKAATVKTKVWKDNLHHRFSSIGREQTNLDHSSKLALTWMIGCWRILADREPKRQKQEVLIHSLSKSSSVTRLLRIQEPAPKLWSLEC